MQGSKGREDGQSLLAGPSTAIEASSASDSDWVDIWQDKKKSALRVRMFRGFGLRKLLMDLYAGLGAETYIISEADPCISLETYEHPSFSLVSRVGGGGA